MISNNFNNFLVDGGKPRKNGLYCPFFRGIAPSTEKILQSFRKSLHWSDVCQVFLLLVPNI